MIDTLRRASAGRITAVIPYFGYGRTDKKDQPRVPITACLVAKLVGVAGADRVLAIDLHAGQIQGFFDIPVDEMSAMFLTANYFVEKRLENPVVVSPDLGNTKRARNFAEILDAPLAIIEKRRIGNQDRSRGAEPDRIGRRLPGRDRRRRDRHGRIDHAGGAGLHGRGRDRGLCHLRAPGPLRTGGRATAEERASRDRGHRHDPDSARTSGSTS